MTDTHILMAGATVAVALLFAMIGFERHWWCRTPCCAQRRAHRRALRRRKRIQGHWREMARTPRTTTLAHLARQQLP